MTIVYILIAIAMLGVLIFLHELGHYLVGRLMNIGIQEFAIGMGPKLFSRKGTHNIKVNGEIKQETTTYSLRLLPLGGFCAFVGEDENNSDPSAMNNAPAWKRFLTVLAGPMMNLLVAFVIGAVLIGFSLIPNPYEVSGKTDIVIRKVSQGMPAEAAGLLPEDVILSADGVSMENAELSAFTEHVKNVPEGQSVTLVIERTEDGETKQLTLTATPVVTEEDGRPMLGVEISQRGYYAQYDCNVFEAMGESVVLMKNVAVDTYESLVGLLKKLFSGERMPEGAVSGPVGIVAGISGTLEDSFSERFGSGLMYVFLYLQMISLSLGIMNLLPLPALDGGRLVLLLAEIVTGKHLNRRAEGYLNLAGLVLLLGLMAVVTFSDIKNLFK